MRKLHYLKTMVRRPKQMRAGNWLKGVSEALKELANEMRASGYSEPAWLIEVAALSVDEADPATQSLSADNEA